MMKFFLSSTLTLSFAAAGFAQQPISSNVPDSVRAMIEASQSGSRFESMARMQVDMQYGEFLTSLSGGERKRQAVEQALVDVISERAELSELTATGRATPAELEAIASYLYLRSQVASLLSSDELDRLDAQQGAQAERNLRRNYTEQMDQAAPELSEPNREIVLDTLVRFMLFSDGNSEQRNRLSAEDLVNQQLMTLRSAREELQDRFTGDQLQQVNAFLDHLRSNLFLSSSMDEGAVR